MNLKCLQRLGLAFSRIVLMTLLIHPSFAQKKSNSGKDSTDAAGGSTSSGGSKGSQGGAAPDGSSASAGPSGRIEATMLAYESSDKIAEYIAGQIKGYRVFVYDSQSFGTLQAYDVYAATVSEFELGFRMLEAGQIPPQSSLTAIAPAIEGIVGTITALRSTAEYAAQPVDLQADAVVAQLANRLPNSVIVPKIVLISDDLQSPDPTKLEKTNCSSIRKTIPQQIGCLLAIRNDAYVAVEKKGETDTKAFREFDKLFQAFFGTMVGSSVNFSTSNKANPGKAENPSGAAAPSDAGGSKPTGDGEQPAAASPLGSIIMGRRLKAQLANDDRKSRIMVLETTAAGGGSRIKHNFWVELFWITPTPTFTGGTVMTYVLIDPYSSVVEKSGVLRFTVDYGKFHGKKIETPSNFP